jgi:hypothetical protein
MSELINNKEHRQEKLKTLIKKLHDGSNFEEVKEEFEKEFGSVHVSEITAIVSITITLIKTFGVISFNKAIVNGTKVISATSLVTNIDKKNIKKPK